MFPPNQNVTVTIKGKVVAAHATPPMPVILPYDPEIALVGVRALVTAGHRPMPLGTPGTCELTLYGIDSGNNLYDISQVAWVSPPQVVQWDASTGPPMPPNLTPNERAVWIATNILSLSFQQQSDAPGKLVGMSFTEIAPSTQSIPPTSEIQVSCVIAMNDGSNGWSFNDSAATVAAGTPPAAPEPTYDVTLIFDDVDPPFTMRLKGVPQNNLAAD